jgi:hypothetical protein
MTLRCRALPGLPACGGIVVADEQFYSRTGPGAWCGGGGGAGVEEGEVAFGEAGGERVIRALGGCCRDAGAGLSSGPECLQLGFGCLVPVACAGGADGAAGVLGVDHEVEFIRAGVAVGSWALRRGQPGDSRRW